MFGLDSIWHWLIILIVVALIFGTSKLRNVGSDLSAAIKNFRKGLQDDDEPASSAKLKADDAGTNESASSRSKSEDTQ